MKEDIIACIRNLVVEKGKNYKSLDLNVLGYLNIIGICPFNLMKGKSIYKKLIGFIMEYHILDQYDAHLKENKLFERLILFVQQQKWSTDNVVMAQDFESELSITPAELSTSMTSRKSNQSVVYNKVEYGIIEKRIGEEVYSEIDIELTNILKEFNNWIKDYLKVFSNTRIRKGDLIQLLKIIVSN